MQGGGAGLRITTDERHLPAVQRLWREHSATLGFFPDGAFDDYARRRQILVAEDGAGACVGYLLYRRSGARVAIVHLCVDPAARGAGVARHLVDALRSSARDCYEIALTCRRDFAAHTFWPHLGFVPVGEEPGRGRTPATLTRWRCQLTQPPLLALLTSASRGQRALAVLDANVFFDLLQPPTPAGVESRALEADWLGDTLALAVTDEIYVEIDRHKSAAERARGRTFVTRFVQLHADAGRAAVALARVRHVYGEPTSTNDESDQRQLANAIAAEADFFVTRDSGLLERADEATTELGVEIVRPVDLVLQLDERVRSVEYVPARLAASDLQTRRVQPEHLERLDVACAVAAGETVKKFRDELRRLAASPDRWTASVIVEHAGAPLALLVVGRPDDATLTVPMLRVARGPLARTLARQLAWRCVEQAVEEHRSVTLVTDPFVTEDVGEALAESWFMRCEDGLAKCHVTQLLPSADVTRVIGGMASVPSAGQRFLSQLFSALTEGDRSQGTTTRREVERMLWPVKLLDVPIPNFLVPIRAKWATSLFDQGLAAQELFGRARHLALGLEHVYYRACVPHVLSAPARVLWYVCDDPDYQGTQQVRACSVIDEVVVGAPKELFRRFKRLGVYRWEDVLAAARGEVGGVAMAFRFSQTELFTAPVSRRDLESVCRSESGGRPQLQSPWKLPDRVFREVYARGTGMAQARGA